MRLGLPVVNGKSRLGHAQLLRRRRRPRDPSRSPPPTTTTSCSSTRVRAHRETRRHGNGGETQTRGGDTQIHKILFIHNTWLQVEAAMGRDGGAQRYTDRDSGHNPHVANFTPVDLELLLQKREPLATEKH
ncbi:unnamed protein product [Lampetra fluviatilis]